MNSELFLLPRSTQFLLKVLGNEIFYGDRLVLKGPPCLNKDDLNSMHKFCSCREVRSQCCRT